MKNIIEFKTNENVEVLSAKFEDMITEVDKEELVPNLKHALFLQFVDILGKIETINTCEKSRLKDVRENQEQEM